MKRNLMIAAVLLVMAGCNGKHAAYREAGEAKSLLLNSDSVAADKIIKTADLRFRVKDAVRTKSLISKQIRDFGGLLSESAMETQVQDREKMKYSTDSLLEVSSYTTEATMIARIPAEKLDRFTDTVVRYADFLDQQSIRFDQASLKYQVSKLKSRSRQEAVSNTESRSLKPESKAAALAISDEYVDQQAVQAAIDDQVKFSTVSIRFYQDNQIKKLLTANDRLADYRPPFFSRLGLNLLNSWSLFKEFLLLLADLWIFMAVAAVILYGIRFLRKRRQGKRLQ